MIGDASLVGHQVGDYTIVSELERTDGARFFAARHTTYGSPAMVKVLAQSRVSDPVWLRRFLDEARAANMVQHPAIVRVVQCDMQDRLGIYMVQEHVDGETVAHRVQRIGPLDLGQACEVLVRCAEALEAAHRQRIIHRNVRPDHLLLEPDATAPLGFRVRLSGFGMAKLVEDRDALPDDTCTGTGLGVSPFSPPEQAVDAKRVTLQADIYSLAAVTWFALCAQPPFPDNGAGLLLKAQLTGRPASLCGLNPAVPPAFEGVLVQALDADPGRRFADMGHFARAAFHAATSTQSTEITRQNSEPIAHDPLDAPTEVMDGLPSDLRPGRSRDRDPRR